MKSAPAQRAYFVEEPRGEHRVETRGNALMQRSAIARHERELEDPPRRTLGRAAGERGHRPAGELDDLERALDALRIAAADAFGRRRIERSQPLVQRGPADLRGLVGDAPTHRGIGLGQRGKSLRERAEVEPGAAREQRHAPFARDGFHRGERIAAELGGRVRLRRIANVDQPVRMARERRRVGLRRADVEPAIDQRRIDADQFHRQILRQRDRQAGLAGGGRPHQEYGGRQHQKVRSRVSCIVDKASRLIRAAADT